MKRHAQTLLEEVRRCGGSVRKHKQIGLLVDGPVSDDLFNELLANERAIIAELSRGQRGFVGAIRNVRNRVFG